MSDVRDARACDGDERRIGSPLRSHACPLGHVVVEGGPEARSSLRLVGSLLVWFVMCVHVMTTRGEQGVRSSFRFVGSLDCDLCDVCASDVDERWRGSPLMFHSCWQSTHVILW